MLTACCVFVCASLLVRAQPDAGPCAVRRRVLCRADPFVFAAVAARRGAGAARVRHCHGRRARARNHA
eukprot:365870-Chlamydomonas_euryale.AAC.1